MMMDREGNPKQLARPECPKDWDDIKAIVKQIYWDEDQTLERTIDLMRTLHGFTVTYETPNPLSTNLKKMD